MFSTELLCRSNFCWILPTIISLAFRQVIESREVCEWYKNVCCKGYRWNEERKQCEECKPGYTGDNCTQQCPYPTYGAACQGICNCSNDTCDISLGCRTLTTVATGTVTILRNNSKSIEPKSRTQINLQPRMRSIGVQLNSKDDLPVPHPPSEPSVHFLSIEG